MDWDWEGVPYVDSELAFESVQGSEERGSAEGSGTESTHSGGDSDDGISPLIPPWDRRRRRTAVPREPEVEPLEARIQVFVVPLTGRVVPLYIDPSL